MKPTDMKNITTILTTVIGLFIASSASTQTTSTYLVPDPQSARWSYIETDANGKTVATQYHSVASLDGNGINGSMKLRVEKVSASSPSDTLKNYIFYRYKDGEYMVDMNAIFEGDVLTSLVSDAIEDKDELSEEEMKEAIEKMRSEFSITGEIRGIPRYPEVGELPDYEFQFKFSIFSVKVTGEDRRIAGTEKVVTNAGTFDCFIVEETITTKAMMMKEVEKTRTWYAYGIGLVKEISLDKKGKIQSTMLLDCINW